MPAPSSELAIPGPAPASLPPATRAELDKQRDRVAALVARAGTAKEIAAEVGELGRRYHAHALLDSAFACYQQAARLAPDDSTWPYLLGRVALSLGHPEAAIGPLTTVVELTPGDLLARLGLARALLAAGRASEAEANFAQALGLDPANAVAHLGMAKVMVHRGASRGALAHLWAALDTAPEANAIHHLLATVYRHQDDLQRATFHLRRAGSRQPTMKDPRMAAVELRARGGDRRERAKKALAEGRIDDAARIYRQILTDDPQQYDAALNLGTALMRQQRWEEASAPLERALELAPEAPSALFNLGTLRLRQQRLGPAEDLLRRCLRVQPRHAGGQLNLAHTLRLLGHHAEALAHYQRTTALAPQRPGPYVWRAMMQMRLAAYDQARAGLEVAHRARPGHPPTAHALARLLATCPDGAVRDGRRALVLARRVWAAEPTLEHQRTVAMALAEAGDFQRAAAWQRRLIASAVIPSAGPSVDELTAHLDLYRARRPCRLPWWPMTASSAAMKPER